LSTNYAQFVDFDLTYKDLDVQVDEDPNMVIHHTIKTKTRPDNHYIKINGIEYDVEMYEILEKNRAEIRLFRLNKAYSHVCSFFPMSISQPVVRSILLKFPTNKFSRIIESSLINGEFLFKIDCIMDYEIYFYNQGTYYLKQVAKSTPTVILGPQGDFRIKPTDDQISSIIRKNKYTDLLRTDLALFNEPINNQSLSDAVNNLKLAAKGYIEGDFNTVIINVRNALANNLTKKVPGQNPLNTTIKDACLLKIATKDKDDYKEILNHVGNILASLLSMNHKYAHENQDTIKMRPLHADLELLYFSASLLTKYLTRLNNNKI
jgi:hypothetical protein